MRRIGAEIDLVMTFGNVERLREFARAGAEAPNIFDAAALSHQRDSAPRLERANEDEAVTRATLDQYIEHPVHAVVKIDVGDPGLVAPNESARARAAEGVTRFVVFDEIGLGLNDDACTFFPDQLFP